MQSDEPVEAPLAEPTPGAQRNRNLTALVYDAAFVVLLLGLSYIVVSLVVSDRSFANTTFGTALTLIALGMAGLGLSSAALYRHPDWQPPALFARVPDAWLRLGRRHAYTHGERIFPLAWFGCICAVAAAAAAFAAFAYPLIAVPTVFWQSEGALFIIALIPSYVVRLRAWLRAWRRTP